MPTAPSETRPRERRQRPASGEPGCAGSAQPPPAWRRRSVPWVLVNLFVPVVVWFVAAVSVSLMLSFGHEAISVKGAVASLLALPLLVSGWLTFVYGPGRRWPLALLLIVGSAFALATVLGTGGPLGYE